MNENNIFLKTCLSDLPGSLIETYGKEMGSKIFYDSENILAAELATMDDRGNEVIGKHMRRYILPGYACYRAMLDEGICSEEAVGFVKYELCKSAERMAKFCKSMCSKKYTYWMLRILIRTILKYGYPKQGWTVVMLENSKERIRFDMTSCLYFEELQKRGAKELCPAFCYIDEVSYVPLSPAVLFMRENTLAQTGTKCDFCFKRGS